MGEEIVQPKGTAHEMVKGLNVKKEENSTLGSGKGQHEPDQARLCKHVQAFGPPYE